MMTVVEFKQEHLDKIEAKTIYSGDVPKTVMVQAFTVMDGETVMMIFGAFLFIEGVIHFWALISDRVHEKPLAFHRITRKILDYYEKRDKPRRMQMDVRADYPEGQRWARALGFEYEGTMKRYGSDGKDYQLFARVR